MPLFSFLFFFPIQHRLVRLESAWDRIVSIDPTAEVDKFASFGTEREPGPLVDGGSFKALAADGATSPDHDDEVPLPDDGFGDEPESLFAGVGEEDEVVSAALGASGGLSAFAALL